GSAYCRWRSEAQNPVSRYLANRCFAASTATGAAPEALSCLDNRSWAYSTRAFLEAVRNIHSVALETRRVLSSRASVVPSQRSFPQDCVHKSSVGAESQVGVRTPLQPH